MKYSHIIAGATSTFAMAAPLDERQACGSTWTQCGGIGWSGATCCSTGNTCTKLNDWYFQCLPGSAGPTTTSGSSALPTSSKTTTAPTSQPTSPDDGCEPGSFKWFGVDESCAEFGQGNYPGTWGKHFIFPAESSLSTLIADGYNIFRIPFSMERMVPDKLTNPLATAYLQNLTQTVNFVTGKGAWAVLDPHNFGRYYDSIITDTAAFQKFWGNLASAYKTNDKVIFDTNNEYHDMDQTLVFNLNQAAIDGIRGAGATSQYIFVEGNSWSGAWTWNVTNNNLAALKDPQDKLVYEMHQYLDSDGSGTSDACVSADIGVQRIVGATAWLRQNAKTGILGEFAGGANPQCQTAVKGMLDHLKANSDVWTGACWWAGGPWWGDYIYSFEPPSGTGYAYYNSLLKTYTA